MTSPQKPSALGRVSIDAIRSRFVRHNPDTRPSGEAQRRAAVAIILRDSPEPKNGERPGVEALFIQRAEHPLDPWSGHMAFPGGHQDADDEHLEDAAIRETLEEVGLDLSREMRIGRLDDLNGGRLGAIGMSVSPFVYFHPEPRELRLNEEVADAIWTPLEYLGDPGNVTPYVYPADPAGREFPAFRYRDRYTIWGMTFRMVGGFMRLFDVTLPGDPRMTNVE